MVVAGSLVALSLALAGMTNLWLDARDALTECRTNHTNAVNAAAAETKKARDTSTKALKEINDAIPKLVAQAQAYGVENYKRRYGKLAVANPLDNRPSLGGGVSAPGLRIDSGGDPAGTIQAGVPEGTTGPTIGVDAGYACDQRFLNDAAKAAAIMRGIDIWLDKVGIPREGLH